jgi:hypothetical protein
MRTNSRVTVLSNYYKCRFKTFDIVNFKVRTCLQSTGPPPYHSYSATHSCCGTATNFSGCCNACDCNGASGNASAAALLLLLLLASGCCSAVSCGCCCCCCGACSCNCLVLNGSLQRPGSSDQGDLPLRALLSICLQIFRDVCKHHM